MKRTSNRRGYTCEWEIIDDKIFLTSIVGFFEEDVPNTVLFPEDCDCTASDIDNDEYCKNPLDRDFSLPGYLEKQVVELTDKRLRETYFSMKQDISSEGIDGQQTNAAPTN